MRVLVVVVVVVTGIKQSQLLGLRLSLEFDNIWILTLIFLKNRGDGHIMHQNGHIWNFLVIFVAGTFQPISERAWCWTDALISPIWKNLEGLIAQKSSNKEKNGHSKCYVGHFGPFLRFSPDDQLDICFSDQRDFTESTLVLYILKYSEFNAQYPENQRKYMSNT